MLSRGGGNLAGLLLAVQFAVAPTCGHLVDSSREARCLSKEIALESCQVAREDLSSCEAEKLDRQFACARRR